LCDQKQLLASDKVARYNRIVTITAVVKRNVVVLCSFWNKVVPLFIDKERPTTIVK